MKKIPVGSIVRLKNGPDIVYSRTWVGSQGEVRDYKIEDGFEMFYIKWDHEDWRYNGQQDGWTFANHFELKSLPHEKPEEESQTKTIAKSNKRLKNRKLDPKVEEYIDELEDAFGAASGSEGFLVLSVSRSRNSERGITDFIPEVHSSFQSLEARAAIEVLLAEILSNSHRDILGHLLQSDQ